METGNEHYLQIARMSAHNTKQSMNWDGTLYPGQPKGLQLEAFPVTLPRRSNGVMTALNWNYAAHLDPMFRFKDAFGTPDLETVEAMPLAERLRLNNQYSILQSSNYGQNNATASIEIRKKEIPDAENLKIYPNPAKRGEKIYIELPSGITVAKAELYDINGKLVLNVNIYESLSDVKLPSNIVEGQYVLRITGKNIHAVQKIIVK
jgi:hypothetical protein